MSVKINAGARPEGAATEQAAAATVQTMFDAIAPSYDSLNHILSAGIDRLWWWRAACNFRQTLANPQALAVDLCCGTGDMTLALDKHRPATNPGAPRLDSETWVSKPILAIDFSHQMLSRGAAKFLNKNIIPIEADALHLPLADNSVDLVTFAFGFRNLANYAEGLAEIFRTLKPGGQLGILECNQPEGLIGVAYNLYFKHVLPTVGGLISKDATAYQYLPASVAAFPRSPRMKQLLTAAGFENPTWTSYTLGIAGLYKATKPGCPTS